MRTYSNADKKLKKIDFSNHFQRLTKRYEPNELEK